MENRAGSAQSKKRTRPTAGWSAKTISVSTSSSTSGASLHERSACIQCDLIVTIGTVEEGQRAACPRCGYVLTSRSVDGLNRSLAFAVAASVLLVMASTFPFLALKANGLEQVMTLPRTAAALHDGGYTSIAILVLGSIVVIPAFVLLTVMSLVVPLRQRRNVPWLVPAGRFLFTLNRWSMVEVFVIGVLVSLVKISDLATVVLGISFWAYLGFAICFTATLAGLDKLQLWREIEACKS